MESTTVETIIEILNIQYRIIQSCVCVFVLPLGEHVHASSPGTETLLSENKEFHKVTKVCGLDSVYYTISV